MEKERSHSHKQFSARDGFLKTNRWEKSPFTIKIGNGEGKISEFISLNPECYRHLKRRTR
ncbi:hypothetical protein CH375_10975 [Leptospira ellisii]|uniref:Uncharacterized protein n=1 Tax=Leptospira ellisii TaxID=2023197 RepID=A0A2N0BD81_9LEPT|nr:hypothetical protein CH379_02205 [Leptospira ellisii]PKA04432.1 hypothetical protein CH375_10975 [Leptospira ellisii]